jgi:MFS transporter, DHA1 family, tetracycline resistance protein
MTPSPRLPLIFIVATVTLDAIGIGLIFPVLPRLIEEVTGRPISEAALWGGILTSSFAAMQFLFGPPLGALSDRYGRRPVLLVSMAVMSLSYLAMALATTVWVLLATRIFAGITSATQSTATAFIADITPPADRGRRFGLIGAGFGAGFVLGPIMGGLLAEVHLHAPFYAAAALALANLILGQIVLPETLTPENRRPFSLAASNPFTALWTAIRLPELRRILLCFFVLAVAMNVYPAIWPYFGPVAFGWTTTMVGLSLTLYGIFFALGQALLVGRLIKRLGEHRAALFAMVANAVTLFGIGLAISGPIVLVITPITALGGAATPALQAIASRTTRADAQGQLQGVLSSINSVAMIVSPLIMTQVFHLFTGPTAPILAPGAPFLLAALLMVVCVMLHVAGSRAAKPAAP